MRVCLIVAMARNRAIGAGGGLPWRISDDLKNFKHLTLGKPVIMGRKTYESLGKPLAERPNIVITRNRSYPDDGIYVVEDLEAALNAAGAFSRIIPRPDCGPLVERGVKGDLNFGTERIEMTYDRFDRCTGQHA